MTENQIRKELENYKSDLCRIIADMLGQEKPYKHPDPPEGSLADIRSACVKAICSTEQGFDYLVAYLEKHWPEKGHTTKIQFLVAMSDEDWIDATVSTWKEMKK